MTPQEKKEMMFAIAEKLYTNHEAKRDILYLLMERIIKGEKPVSKEFFNKLIKRLFIKQEDSKVPVMERILTRFYKDESGKIVSEQKKVKELVSQDKKDGDFWIVDGKKLLSHQGIKKCADFVEITFGTPDAIDKPNSNNGKGFYLGVQASSLNRIPTYEVGSGNDSNAKGEISSSFRFEMAHKRAVDRAFLSHVGFHDVYSGEETDQWSKEEYLRRQLEEQKKVVQQVGEKARNEVARRNRMIDELLKYVALPSDDVKYPNTYITTVIERGDYEYMQHLTNHPDKNIGWAANRLLTLHSMTIEEQEAMEQIPTKSSDEPIDINEESPSESSEQQENLEEQPTDLTQQEEAGKVADLQDFLGHSELETTEKHLEKDEPNEGKKEEPQENQQNKGKQQSKPFTIEPIEGEDEEGYINVDFRLDKEDK